MSTHKSGCECKDFGCLDRHRSHGCFCMTDSDWPLADPSTAAALNAAVELGADALWGNRNRNAAVPSSPGPDYADRLMARVVLGAAAPSIAIKASADERQRIRQRLNELAYLDQHLRRQITAYVLDGAS